ncbi:MAG: histidinol-phosphate transaminase [Burkholderiaceae bacterium]
MNPLWSTGIRHLEAYQPGEQPQIPGLIKLNTNENPYPPSPAALAALRAAANDDLRLYPDPAATGLRERIAAAAGLGIENVFVGNGSDEVLAHLFRALFEHELPILFPDITYSFYPVYCGLFGIRFETVPLDASFAIDIDHYRRPNGGIIIANPNAPTGLALGLDAIRALLANNPDSAVVIDEAYVDFGADSAIGLISDHPNLLVVQTLSKSRSLAGLRVGFAIAQPGLIQALDLVKNCFNSYPVGRVALAGATAAIDDRPYFEATRRKIMATRERLSIQLSALGFEVLPSMANFVFARHTSTPAAQIQQALRERRILVRRFDKPRISEFLRITIGSDEHCDALVSALGEIIG